MEFTSLLSREAEIAMETSGVRLDGIQCSSASGKVVVSVVDHERRFIGRAENRGDLSLALDEALRKALDEVAVWLATDRRGPHYPHHPTLNLPPLA